ncbi:MAG: imidazole glycerol phosphate synthase subunit HisH [Chromatiales bacterium]|nr:imidazole glycerol phosphate synthase subunit HisH [Chromatiales bacterium]
MSAGSPATRVVIIDSGGANIASLRYALARLGHQSRLSSDPDEISGATHVILPGVGAAAAAMEQLRSRGLDQLIPRLTRPLLGICLGMQLLFEHSAEDDARCLGILPGGAGRLPGGSGLPVPHMGWNQLELCASSPLFNGVSSGDWCYFVHSYAVPVAPATLATSTYGIRFSAVAGQANFFGTQFHPERSGVTGARILANFLALD